LWLSSESNCTQVAKDINPLILNLNNYNYVIPQKALLLSNYTIGETTATCTMMMNANNNTAYNSTIYSENELGMPFLKSFKLGLTIDSTILAEPNTDAGACLYLSSATNLTCNCFNLTTPAACSPAPTPIPDKKSKIGLIIGLLVAFIAAIIIVVLLCLWLKKRQAT